MRMRCGEYAQARDGAGAHPPTLPRAAAFLSTGEFLSRGQATVDVIKPAANAQDETVVCVFCKTARVLRSFQHAVADYSVVPASASGRGGRPWSRSHATEDLLIAAEFVEAETGMGADALEQADPDRPIGRVGATAHRDDATDMTDGPSHRHWPSVRLASRTYRLPIDSTNARASSPNRS